MENRDNLNCKSNCILFLLIPTRFSHIAAEKSDGHLTLQWENNVYHNLQGQIKVHLYLTNMISLLQCKQVCFASFCFAAYRKILTCVPKNQIEVRRSFWCTVLAHSCSKCTT